MDHHQRPESLYLARPGCSTNAPRGVYLRAFAPPGLTKAALDGIREHARDRALRITERDDPELNERIRQHRESLKGRNSPPRDPDR